MTLVSEILLLPGACVIQKHIVLALAMRMVGDFELSNLF